MSYSAKARTSINKRSFLLIFIESFFFFFYLYQSSLEFLGLPKFLHSSRISSIVFVLAALFIVLAKNSQHSIKVPITMRSLKSIIILNISLLIYMFALSTTLGRGEGSTMIEPIISLFIFGFVPMWAFSKIFRSLDEFMTILIITTIAQTIIIWLSIINPQLSVIIDNTFNVSEWYQSHRSGYAGGIGCITSQGVVRYAIGFIACLYKFNKKSSNSYLILYIIFLITASMISRTGLLVGFIGFFFFLNIESHPSKSTIIWIGLTILVAYFIASYFLTNNIYLLEKYFSRYELLEGNGLKKWFIDYYFGDEAGNIIPPISIETIIGTSITSGTSGNGIIVNADGGFIRLYVAFGLPLAIFFYYFVFKQLGYVIKRTFDPIDKKILFLFSILLIIGEFKEFYLYTIFPIPIFYLISILSERDRYENVRYA